MPERGIERTWVAIKSRGWNGVAMRAKASEERRAITSRHLLVEPARGPAPVASLHRESQANDRGRPRMLHGLGWRFGVNLAIIVLIWRHPCTTGVEPRREDAQVPRTTIVSVSGARSRRARTPRCTFC